MVVYTVFSGHAERQEATDFMFSLSNYTCKFEHLKIVTFYNSWYLKVALSVGEVAKFEVSTVASLESFKGVGCHPI